MTQIKLSKNSNDGATYSIERTIHRTFPSRVPGGETEPTITITVNGQQSIGMWRKDFDALLRDFDALGVQ